MTSRRDENHLSFGIWCSYIRDFTVGFFRIRLLIHAVTPTAVRLFGHRNLKAVTVTNNLVVTKDTGGCHIGQINFCS